MCVQSATSALNFSFFFVFSALDYLISSAGMEIMKNCSELEGGVFPLYRAFVQEKELQSDYGQHLYSLFFFSLLIHTKTTLSNSLRSLLICFGVVSLVDLRDRSIHECSHYLLHDGEARTGRKLLIYCAAHSRYAAVVIVMVYVSFVLRWWYVSVIKLTIEWNCGFVLNTYVTGIISTN